MALPPLDNGELEHSPGTSGHAHCQNGTCAERMETPLPESGPPGRGRYRQAMMETSIFLCLLENELHGYDLVERIDEMIGSFVCVDPGSTYRMLRDLENGGHLVSTWQPAESGPARRTYSVTDSGRELLAQWATFLERRARVMDALAAKARGQLGATVETQEHSDSSNKS